MSDELAFRSIGALSPDLRDGRLSPRALLEATLDRIGRFDPELQSFVHLSDTAREAADAAGREIAEGRWRGPLHGVPIAVKDNYLTADMPTTAGTMARGITFPLRDSTAARKLRDAGAVLIGKTRTHEFAWGTITPPTRNPWGKDRIPGGSSGGSGAAVAAGLCAGALGSDTGGSIRIPASLCGTVGLKPTFGRVSRTGVVPHSWSLDHAGPLTRTVEDAAILLDAISGYDPSDPGCADRAVPNYRAGLDGGPASRLRIAVCRNHFFGRNQHAVEQAVEQAIGWFSAQGATISNVTVPNLEYGLGAIFAIELSSSSAYHDVSLRAGRTEEFTPDVRMLVELGRFVTGPDYLKAEQFRQVLMKDFQTVFRDADLIIGPTMPITAPRVGDSIVELAEGQESTLAATWRLTYPYNLTGLPAISLPCGFDANGLPIGLQIAARPFDEVLMLRTAHAYEVAHEWKDRHPD